MSTDDAGKYVALLGVSVSVQICVLVQTMQAI